MTLVNLSNYSLYPYLEDAPGDANHLPVHVARADFDRMMVVKENRLDQLSALAKDNGLNLARNDASIQRLNDWYIEVAEPFRPGDCVPSPWWYSVTVDLSIFLGEVIIEQCPGARWKFDTSKSMHIISRHQPVIVLPSTSGAQREQPIAIRLKTLMYSSRILKSRLPQEGLKLWEQVFWEPRFDTELVDLLRRSRVTGDGSARFNVEPDQVVVGLGEGLAKN